MNSARVVTSLMFAVAAMLGTGAPGYAAATHVTTSDFDCSDKPDGNYSDPADSTKYYSCVAHKHAYLQSCPPGQHFNPGRDQCE